LAEALALALFASLMAALLLGFPVAFTLAGVSLLFAGIGHLLDQFDLVLFLGLAPRYFGVMTNETLVAVPLFIFMGMILERSGIADDLLTTMGRLFGPLRGGLGVSVVLVGAVLAASTGVVGATVVTMGLIALPSMLKAGYDDRLATGVICASATLAQIVPPSTILIFLADILQGVNQAAQLQKGNLSPTPVSVGDLFAGALLPGLLLVGLYLAWVALQALLFPARCPALPAGPGERRALLRSLLPALVLPLGLILAVLGSILAGIATATESASIGAVGAVLWAILRRRLTPTLFWEAAVGTARTSAVIFAILLGASVFSLVFRGLGGEALVTDALAALPGGATAALVACMLVMFLLGFFLDTLEIIFVMVPIFGPPLLLLGIDPIWLGVLIGINLQTSFLTPPFGFTLFYLRSVAPPAVTTSAIWAGVVPFVALQLLGLGLVWALPATATWLPEVIFGTSFSPGAGRPPARGPSLEDLLGPPPPLEPLPSPATPALR
jgi:tripartite ATP-independent transporter DctM subunit